jgi:capsular polysaccharide biosynthesis protein
MPEQRTPSDETLPEPAAPPDSDAPVDVRRVVGAVRRGGWVVAAVVVAVTGLVLAVSLMSPDRYRATARIAPVPAPGEAVDIETADRQLAASSELVTATPVLADAAGRLPGETVETLQADVSAGFDPAVGILDVVATGDDPGRTARVANTVAEQFLTERERVEERVATRATQRLSDELERLREDGAPAATLELMRERLSELAVSEVTAGSDLRLAQRAATPSAPYAPRPLMSAVLAFFSALVLGVLIAIAVDRLRPASVDAAALSRITGLPVIAALPSLRGARPEELLRRALRRPRRASRTVDQTVIEEAALQGAVRGALPPRGQRVVLVHAIDDYDGAAQVATGLARSLIWGGHATVLVRFKEPDGGGPPDVPTVRCGDIADQLDELRATDYRYVIVQSPHAARGARLRPLAARTAAVVLVARLGQAGEADASAARRLIEALGLRGLGLVVICSPGEIPGVLRASHAAPPPAMRLRSASPNGAHAAVAASERAAGTR